MGKRKHTFIPLIIVMLLISNVVKAGFAQNNLPNFENYRTKNIFKEKPKAIDFSSYPEAKQFKTRLTEGEAKGPNYAGHYTVIPI